MTKFFFWTFGLILFAFLGHMLVLANLGLNDREHRADLLVVDAVDAADRYGMPKDQFYRRLSRVADYYHSGYAIEILISGPPGLADGGTAPLIANYLSGKGVPPDLLIFDYNSRNLDDLVVTTREVLERRSLSSVMIVGSYYSMARLRVAFDRQGIRKVAHANTANIGPGSLLALAGEVPKFYRYLLSGRKETRNEVTLVSSPGIYRSSYRSY